jgi:hypothetical protein
MRSGERRCGAVAALLDDRAARAHDAAIATGTDPVDALAKNYCWLSCGNRIERNSAC